jgi:hypothetical protein
LPGHVLGELGAISAADVEAFVATEEGAAVPDSNQAGIVFGVDNEHAGSSNDDVVNVASGARYASVMQYCDPIDADQNLTELSLAYGSSFPGSRRLLFAGDCECDTPNDVPKTSFDPRLSSSASAFVFPMGRRPSRPANNLTRRLSRPRIANDAANSLRFRVIKSLRAFDQFGSAENAIASVAQTTTAKCWFTGMGSTIVSRQCASEFRTRGDDLNE